MGDIDIVSCLVGNGASINKISKNQFKHSPISALLFYKAFEVSSLFEYKNEIDAVADYVVSEPGNPNVTPNAMGRGRSSMQMNPYGNPYGMGMMPGMIPGGFSTDGLGYNSGGVKLTNLNGPLSKYPYPGDSSIYSITMENRLNGENVVDLDSQMDILLDFRNSQHFIIYEYLEQKGAKLENKDQELIKILHEPYKYFSIGKNESSNIITKEAATNRKFDETQDPELSADKPLSAREAYRFYWGIVEELHNMKQNSIDSFEGLEERAKRERLTKNEMIKKVKKETSAFVLNQYMELHVLIENQTSNRISRLASLFYCLNASWNEGAAGDYLFVKRKLPKSQEDAYLRIKGFNKFLKGSTLLGIKRTAGYVVSVNKAKAYVKKYPNLQFDWKSNYKIFLSEFPWTFKRELAEIAKKIN
jgi:hypothetical protein